MAPINSNLLQVTKEQRRAIRKEIQLDNEDIQQYVNEVLKWYETQLHLPRIKLDPVIVERFLISRKGSVAQTKEKIDSMFTIRNTYMELSRPRDIRHSDIRKVHDSVLLAPLPKLNHDNTRVYFCRYTPDVHNYNVGNAANYLFMTMDYRLRYDYSSGDRLILDMKHKTWRHFTKELNPLSIRIEKYLRDGYGLRIKGLHFLNAPVYINKFLAMFKLFLPKKLMDRINIHSSLEDIYSVIDQDILPEEYGGKEKALEDIVDEWQEELGQESIRKYLVRQEILRSDESKRKK